MSCTARAAVQQCFRVCMRAHQPCWWSCRRCWQTRRMRPATGRHASPGRRRLQAGPEPSAGWPATAPTPAQIRETILHVSSRPSRSAAMRHRSDQLGTLSATQSRDMRFLIGASSAVQFDPEVRPAPQPVSCPIRHNHAAGCRHHESHLLLLSAHNNGASCGGAGGRPGTQLLSLAQHNAPQVGGHRQRHRDCLLAAWMTSVRLWAVLVRGCAAGDICRFSQAYPGH